MQHTLSLPGTPNRRRSISRRATAIRRWRRYDHNDAMQCVHCAPRIEPKQPSDAVARCVIPTAFLHTRATAARSFALSCRPRHAPTSAATRARHRPSLRTSSGTEQRPGPPARPCEAWRPQPSFVFAPSLPGKSPSKSPQSRAYPIRTLASHTPHREPTSARPASPCSSQLTASWEPGQPET
ncbi:hypothetical protein C8Q78DRAFT_667792 [Trametes maxima]|nr:hypothetical protein C8Q78DRAFT_667792 [Trametes maxima]